MILAHAKILEFLLSRKLWINVYVVLGEIFNKVRPSEACIGCRRHIEYVRVHKMVRAIPFSVCIMLEFDAMRVLRRIFNEVGERGTDLLSGT